MGSTGPLVVEVAVSEDVAVAVGVGVMMGGM